MICPRCGKDNSNETDFCSVCGEKMQNSPDVEPNVPYMGQMPNGQSMYTNGFSQGNPYITGGINLNQQNMGMGAPVFVPQVQKNGTHAQTDHTSEFSEKDVSNHKIYAMLPYLMGTIGIIIALLAAKKSKYVRFHVRQALKLTIISVILTIISIPFSVLGLIPIAGIIFMLVAVCIGIVQIGVFILKIIGFFQVCEGKAKEPAIIGSFDMFR